MGNRDAQATLGELHGELARIGPASHSVRLGIGADAAVPEIRKAFLGLVQKYHPHRFSHLGRECEVVANELFLLIKESHDALVEAAGKPHLRKKKKTTAPPPGPEKPPNGFGGAVRFRGGGKPKPAEDPGKTAPMRPLVIRGLANRRNSKPTPAKERSPKSTLVRRAQAAEAAKNQKNGNGRVLIPDGPIDLDGPAPTDHVHLVAKLESEEETKLARYRAASKLLREGRANEARVAFRELAVENPTDKRYRTYMHFAWGREHELAGRNDEAIAEYQRALNVNPKFTPALEAFEALEALSEKGGVFGRLFRGRQK